MARMFEQVRRYAYGNAEYVRFYPLGKELGMGRECLGLDACCLLGNNRCRSGNIREINDTGFRTVHRIPSPRARLAPIASRAALLPARNRPPDRYGAGHSDA